MSGHKSRVSQVSQSIPRSGLSACVTRQKLSTVAYLEGVRADVQFFLQRCANDGFKVDENKLI